MKRAVQCGGAAALVILLSVSMLSANGLLQPDTQRLEAAQARHAKDRERAAQVYRAAMERANTGLERTYQQVIQSYEQRGDTATVEALEGEIAELLAQANEPIAPAPAAEPGHVKMIEAIGQTLVNGNNQAVPSDTLAERDYVLLYFSAAWCGPCRAFTPSLVEFHRRNAERGNFEVVFVSSDRSAAEMSKYMRADQMPFLAVPFDRINATGLKKTYGGRGIPNLVIVDRDGEVVSGSYVDGQYVGPRRVLADMQALLQ